MKVEIVYEKKVGILQITAENDLERFALDYWCKENSNNSKNLMVQLYEPCKKASV